MKRPSMAAFIVLGASALAQAPSESLAPGRTMRQLMLDLIHPASNEILLSIYRGGPKDDAEWSAVRRSALALAESGTLLTTRGRARDQNDWPKYAKLLADTGAAAYDAALAKDAK